MGRVLQEEGAKAPLSAMKRAIFEERQLMLCRMHGKKSVKKEKKRVPLERKGLMLYEMGSGLKDF